MTVQAWSVRLSALAFIVLLPSIAGFGACGEPTGEPQNEGAGSKSSNLSEQEEADIKWNQLCEMVLPQGNGMGDQGWSSELIPENGHDSPRKLVLSLNQERTTSTAHGLLRRQWKQRTIRRIELVEVSNERHVVIKTEAFVALKAPIGAWHRKERDFQLPHLLGQEITGKPPDDGCETPPPK